MHSYATTFTDLVGNNVYMCVSVVLLVRAFSLDMLMVLLFDIFLKMKELVKHKLVLALIDDVTSMCFVLDCRIVHFKYYI